MTLAGFPTATQKSGIFLVTTLPAPTTVFLPTITPANIMLLAPIQQPCSNTTFFASQCP